MRTTKSLVAKIIELDATIVTSNSDMAAFGDPASAMVDFACTGTNGPKVEYTAEQLELIERWLTAHLYTARDPRTVSEKAGSVGATFQSKVDLGLNSSHYGQTAMRLDTNGGLAKVEKDTKDGGPPAVGGFWAGKKPV
jgi:hypothetical protein